jgi:small-conductance mechanosensitive channel
LSAVLASLQTYAFLAVAIIVALVLAKLASRLVVRLRKQLELRGSIPQGFVGLIAVTFRALIWLTAGAFVLLEVLVTLGLRQVLVDSVSSFLSINAGRIGVMVIIIIGGFVFVRILSIFFVEYRRRTKLHSMTVELLQTVIRYLVYAVVAILLFTNILVMAGLQTLAGSLVTLFAVFIGLVVSFAATGSIGNALSGLVIMSWRPYREGDRVDIGGNIYGDVIEVDAMFTKIRTIKDELIHVPNSQVLNNKIINYSTFPRVIVHYQITIGYDAPRKRVEQLLLRAAEDTSPLLTDPKPFVLVRDLNNNYVTYEINAYTDQPNQLVTTYSNLMKNILDRFSGAGVEILSPQHIAIRKSKATARRRRRNQANLANSGNLGT